MHGMFVPASIKREVISVLGSYSTDKIYGEIGLSENSPSSSDGSDSSELR